MSGCAFDILKDKVETQQVKINSWNQLRNMHNKKAERHALAFSSSW